MNRPAVGPTAIRAGAAYFAIVFTIAFVFGTIRVTVVAPSLGETAAVLVEAPLLIAASWIVCGWIVDRFRVRAQLRARSWMGGIAFILLLLVETGLAVLAFGQTLPEWLAGYASLAGGIGLFAQIIFAFTPILQGLLGKYTRR